MPKANAHSGSAPDADTVAFWAATRRRVLLLRKCIACHRSRLEGLFCPTCLSRDYEDVEATGRGIVYAFTVVHRAPSKTFSKETPYILAVIELSEGVKMLSHVINCLPGNATIGMEVHVAFEDVTKGRVLPKFEPTSLK